MVVDDSLQEIDDVVEDVFDLRTRHQAKQKAGSRRNVYEKSIREVRNVAGNEEATVLAEWIKDRIRTKETFPSGRDVRQRGAEICRENGHEVSTGSWLGA